MQRQLRLTPRARGAVGKTYERERLSGFWRGAAYRIGPFFRPVGRQMRPVRRVERVLTMWGRQILNREAGSPAGAECSERVALELDHFAGQALADEARRLGATIEQLAKFAVLYYLADLDSGRIARTFDGRASRSQSSGSPRSRR